MEGRPGKWALFQPTGLQTLVYRSGRFVVATTDQHTQQIDKVRWRSITSNQDQRQAAAAPTATGNMVGRSWRASASASVRCSVKESGCETVRGEEEREVGSR